MEADFGIIPYPKLDEAQKQYVSRVEYYFPTIVPINSDSLGITGVMLEALQSESAKTVRPAYYDIALKTKYTRDDESAQISTLFSPRGSSTWATPRFATKSETALWRRCFRQITAILPQLKTNGEYNQKSYKNITEKVPETQ